ncbi:uncharacterized protein LOC142318234 [Lycorma delicatula]|uniref:uncharacterized protein LOC142318234 n=1 Tax=Lycorma delicatula TaxID=130591 RepID=UPI003F5123E3
MIKNGKLLCLKNWHFILFISTIIQNIFARYDPHIENDSRLEIISADNYGNIYIYVEVSPKKIENTISKFEWDIVSVDVKAQTCGNKANEQLVKLLAGVLEVKEDQLKIIKGKDQPLKKVKLTGWKGTEFQVIHKIAFKCKYVLDAQPDRRYLNSFQMSDSEEKRKSAITNKSKGRKEVTTLFLRKERNSKTKKQSSSKQKH